MLSLRRADAEDEEFAFGVLKETMQEYAVATWGSWWEEQSRTEIAQQVSSGRTSIIELEGEPIGIQLVERTATHIQLEQLYIAKHYQRRDFGTQLLVKLIDEAKVSHVPIRLRVLAVNPARALYERLGFVVVETTKERFCMQWSTSGSY